ncbi:snRNA-activating protein complex subunit 2 [Pseudophryne corroboree]|uniref:snRNA-activating protein complex subunit 2 n=1 Tax=Pseudophryne corroboree TaxID=495146 RepID=UPI003081DB9C
MKPPLRRRSAPVRYEIQNMAPARPALLRLAWTAREKMELLRALKSQAGKKVPEPQVQGRSQSEVSSYIAWLRGRAAREAVQTEYEKWAKEKKTQDAQTPAPIELWTDLASRMSDPTEETVTSAFSQILTVAATEPVNLCHSIPSKYPRGRAAGATASAGRSVKQKGSSEEAPGSSGEEPTASANKDGWQSLDFEKIYKYLSKAARGEELPQLSGCESAVLLRLLHCIPDQFQALDTAEIGIFLRKTYAFLNSQPKSEPSDTEETQTHPQATSWKDLGLCPLNPFLLPLGLMKQKEEHLTPA